VIYKTLKFIYRLSRNPIRKIRLFNKHIFYFIFPNLSFLFSRRLICKKYPVCQQRIYLTGQGTITIGDHCVFGYKLGGFNRFGSIEIQPRYKESRIVIGNNVSTNNNIFICAANNIEIGNDTMIGQNVTIMDHEAHGIEPTQRRELGEIGQVIIGKNVWIGNNVIILKNTVVGDNSIIAAGAVVNGNFPVNVLIGGVPAKEIKKI
jgi:UDP-3-O-[3-hydroxymyristoyl] glucosamine N-acyltransferase